MANPTYVKVHVQGLEHNGNAIQQMLKERGARTVEAADKLFSDLFSCKPLRFEYPTYRKRHASIGDVVEVSWGASGYTVLGLVIDIVGENEIDPNIDYKPVMRSLFNVSDQ